MPDGVGQVHASRLHAVVQILQAHHLHAQVVHGVATQLAGRLIVEVQGADADLQEHVARAAVASIPGHLCIEPSGVKVNGLLDILGKQVNVLQVVCRSLLPE